MPTTDIQRTDKKGGQSTGIRVLYAQSMITYNDNVQPRETIFPIWIPYFSYESECFDEIKLRFLPPLKIIGT